MLIKRIIAIILSILVSCVTLVACYGDDSDTPNDILSQKAMPKDKINITVLVKYAFSINKFEEVIEQKFPNLNLIQVGNYTYNMGVADYEARMKNDDLTDIVMTWPLIAGDDYCDSRLMDLSSFSFTGNYNNAALQTVSQGHSGKLHYLPGPSQMRGIVYNKTMFDENNWQVPNDYDEFVKLCKDINTTGIKALQLGLQNEEVLDTAFVGYGYADSFSKPENIVALREYNKQIGSFADNFMPALETYKDLIDNGILTAQDLEVDYAEREYMLFNRRCAMTEDSVLLARMGDSISGTADEFALMPFFNPGSISDWVRLYPVCYIGANKHLEESANKKKHDMVIDILEYISTPEGQIMLSADTGGVLSSLREVNIPSLTEIEALIPALQTGHYGVFPTLKNAQQALRKGLAGMITGEYEISDVVEMVDSENMNPQPPQQSQVVGRASGNFTLLETGNFVTDAMREYSGADFALFLDNGKDGRYNGKGISGSLYKGDITLVDLTRILPDIKQGEKTELWVVEMTGANLKRALEYTITINNNLRGWFYYFSGLTMEYAPSAPPGTRIKSISRSNGDSISDEAVYKVAVMDHSVNPDYCLSTQQMDVLIISLLQSAIANSPNATIKPPTDKRFVIKY